MLEGTRTDRVNILSGRARLRVEQNKQEGKEDCLKRGLHLGLFELIYIIKVGFS